MQPLRPVGWRWGFNGSNLFTVVADLLKITPSDLSAQLKDGKTVHDVAKERGLTTADIVKAVMSPRVEQTNAAVKAGRLTQEQADLMIKTMTEQMTQHIESGTCAGTCGTGIGPNSGRGTGQMMGGRMGGGMRGGNFGGRWNVQPSQSL